MRTSCDIIDFTIGKNIKFFRTVAGLNQVELAKPLNLTHQQVQKYENGTNRISASMLFRISKFLSIPIADFFGEQNVEKITHADASFMIDFCSLSKNEKYHIHQVVKAMNELTVEEEL